MRWFKRRGLEWSDGDGCLDFAAKMAVVVIMGIVVVLMLVNS